MPGPEFLGPLACIAGRLDSQVSELDFWGFHAADWAWAGYTDKRP